ncbi:MAG: hypothetical protein QOD99_1730 [Chthoniobacter sp.]|nr:hypothetical protein [Chthoniobacter sp.]
MSTEPRPEAAGPGDAADWQDGAHHCRLARAFAKSNRWRPALAEYRTAITLGCAGSEVHTELDQARSHTEKQELTAIDHNQYYRLKSLADHMRSLFPEPKFSVLDIGGGDGTLCRFLPDADYALIEPSTNGAGAETPLPPRSFDIVSACHVLEHIPAGERPAFLDKLCAAAKKYVLLLNPFFNPSLDEQRRLNFVIELTDAKWAKEHLDCGLPVVDEILSYASSRQLQCRVLPNGSVPNTLALFFLNHYLARCEQPAALARINRFFNTELGDALTSTTAPTARLIELTIS